MSDIDSSGKDVSVGQSCLYLGTADHCYLIMGQLNAAVTSMC